MGTTLFFPRGLVAAGQPTDLLWPIVGGSVLWPAYRKEQAHINDGEGPAFDLGNQLGLTIVAPWDGVIIQSASDPHTNDGAFHAGNVVILQCVYKTVTYRFHFCHQRELWRPQWVALKKGDTIGYVGRTGTGLSPTGELEQMTEGNAHLHLWCEEQRADGSWMRIWPSKLFEGV